jgi:sulfur relay (sulfurtransferase) complex TusBCD TusD component (DsrE family)
MRASCAHVVCSSRSNSHLTADLLTVCSLSLQSQHARMRVHMHQYKHTAVNAGALVNTCSKAAGARGVRPSHARGMLMHTWPGVLVRQPTGLASTFSRAHMLHTAAHRGLVSIVTIADNLVKTL